MHVDDQINIRLLKMDWYLMRRHKEEQEEKQSKKNKRVCVENTSKTKIRDSELLERKKLKRRFTMINHEEKKKIKRKNTM